MKPKMPPGARFLDTTFSVKFNPHEELNGAWYSTSVRESRVWETSFVKSTRRGGTERINALVLCIQGPIVFNPSASQGLAEVLH